MDIRADESRPLRIARRVVLGLLTLELLALLVSGVILYFEYRPSAAAAWTDIYDGSRRASFAEQVRIVHQLAARLAIPTSLCAGVLIGVTAVVRGRRWMNP